MIKNQKSNTYEVRTYYKDWTGVRKQKTKRGFKRKCDAQEWEEYIIESVLHQKVTAVGNPLMLVQFRKQLRGIEEELKRVTTLEDAEEELFTPIRTMLEILNAFAEERNHERRKKEKAQK